MSYPRQFLPKHALAAQTVRECEQALEEARASLKTFTDSGAFSPVFETPQTVILEEKEVVVTIIRDLDSRRSFRYVYSELAQP